jgi:hypothetical protein
VEHVTRTPISQPCRSLNSCLQSPAKVSSTVAGLGRCAASVRPSIAVSKSIGVGCGCHLATAADHRSVARGGRVAEGLSALGGDGRGWMRSPRGGIGCCTSVLHGSWPRGRTQNQRDPLLVLITQFTVYSHGCTVQGCL